MCDLDGLERLTIADAAKLLGVTEAAIRQRVRRGTMQFEKSEGRTYVYVTPSETRRGGVENESRDMLRNPLVESLEDQVQYLRSQLDEERRGSAELRRLLAGAMERIPEIEAPRDAPPEARDSDLTASEEPGGTRRGHPVSQEPETQEERRSWLYRFFFGT